MKMLLHQVLKKTKNMFMISLLKTLDLPSKKKPLNCIPCIAYGRFWFEDEVEYLPDDASDDHMNQSEDSNGTFMFI
jgi:hypothetical protein